MRSTVAAVAALALAGVPALAAAHVELTASSPEAGAVLTTAPDEVVLTFEVEIAPDGSSFSVTDAAGTEVGTGTVDLQVAERNELRGPVEIDESGVYTVSWVALASDGDAVTGEFEFSYRSPATGELADTALPNPRPPATTFIGALLVVGAVAMVERRRVRR